MFKGNLQEVTTIKTSRGDLIEFLRKKRFNMQADFLRNGVTSLELVGKGIGVKGAKLIAEILKDNNFLTQLNLDGSRIGAEGVKLITEALKTNNTLTKLILSHNKIGYEGARLIAEALKANNSLATLDLFVNEIEDEGARLIAEALKANNSLTSLNLSFNKIGDTTILKTIDEYLQRNKTTVEKKAENLNVEGNYLYYQEKYSEAIEKYNAAIKIKKRLDGRCYNKENLYEEKKYEEQQQSLKLILAIQEDKAEEAKDLAKNLNVDTLNKLDNNNNSLLYYALCQAIIQGMESVCEVLISKMSDHIINHLNNDLTALQLAIYKSLEKVCEQLILKMNQLVIDSMTVWVVGNGKILEGTALHFAIICKNEKISKILIDKMNQTAIDSIARFRISEEEYITESEGTALYFALVTGNENISEILINKMSQTAIDSVVIIRETDRPEVKITYLLYTICSHNRNSMWRTNKISEVLISKIVSKVSDQVINYTCEDGNTALTSAAYMGLENICVLLISKMTDQAINQINNNGETALSLATKNGFKNICDLLTLRTNEQNNKINKTNAEKKQEEQQAQILTESSNNELNELVNSFSNDDISVNICFPTISDEAAKLMANKLRNIATITKVSFFGTQISDKGIKIITEALANKRLEKFSFSCSDLGDQKISILAEILQINTLTHIYLGENKIGITGIQAIIEALKLNNTIVYLDLHNNNIGNEGAKLIAEFLKNNNSLKYLDIALNKIDADGAKAIIESLKENIVITDLDLGQNNIGQQNEVIIEKYLQRNKNLMSFQKLVDEINDKVAANIAINAKDKAIIKDTIENIVNNIKALNNITDIDKITANMQKLIVNKSTKLEIITIENQLNEIIDNQNINDDISLLGGDSTFG